MSKFKAGDLVVRIGECNDGAGFVKSGGLYVVKECYSALLWLHGSDTIYAASSFELEKPTFKNMKFRVNSPEHSKEIQEALFEMGYGWKQYGKKVMFADSFPPCDWLYTDNGGHLWRIDCKEDFLACSFITAQEHTVETTKSYKLIPVETPKETIEIDGKTYDKKAVLKRLAELESISK